MSECPYTNLLDPDLYGKGNHLPKLQELRDQAKGPIVKFSDRRSRLEADISLYNTLAQHNTLLLHTYAKLDSRARVRDGARPRGTAAVVSGRYR